MIRRRFFQKESVEYNRDNYLTIEALVDDFTFQFSKGLEYNINGEGWAQLDAEENLPAINNGDFVSLRANHIPLSSNGIGRFVIISANKCKLSGNCMSLLFGDKAYNKNNLSGYAFAFSQLFYECKGITEISSDFLPATTLAPDCYSGMFANCINLVNAPELPATTLAPDCYSSMFRNCINLVNAPELPATTLAPNCYSSMFRGCTNLRYIKALFTTTPSSSYTYLWVSSVYSTGTFVKSKDATWNVTGVNGIPSGWTVQKV